MFRLCPFICLAALLAEVVLDLWPFLPSALLFCASVYICVPIWVVSVLWSILVEFLPLCQPVSENMRGFVGRGARQRGPRIQNTLQ